jgi:hypothetical protein
MKKLTFGLILMTFSSTIIFAQNHIPRQFEKKQNKENIQDITDIAPNIKNNPNATTFTDDLFDHQFDFPVGDGTGESGIETNEEYIYTSKWNGEGFFCYEMDGTFLGAFPVPGEAAVRDMAYDGTYFYGAAASTALYEMDFVGQSGTLISTLTAAVATRACAYDSEFDGFWGNNWSDPITLYDRTGGILNQFNCGAYSSYYGFARLNDAGTEYLYGFAQSGGASQAVIVQIDPYSGAETGVVFDAIEYSSTGTGIAGGLAASDNIVPGSTTLLGIIQNETIFGVEGTAYPYVPDLDLALKSIIEPNSDFGLGVEDIVIKVKNHGAIAQSNFDVQYRVNGDPWVCETVPGPLAMGESFVYTFTQAYDFSAYGVYNIDAEVILADDEFPDNNTSDKTIENRDYSCWCYISITMWDDYGDGWNGGFVQIFGNDEEFLNATLEDGSGPETIEFLVKKSHGTAVWTSGGWPYECSYAIYDMNGYPLFEDGMGGVDPTGGYIGILPCMSYPIIFTTPSGFTVNLDPGTTGQEFLNICNNGYCNLSWSIEVVYAPLGATVPVYEDKKSKYNILITKNEPLKFNNPDMDVLPWITVNSVSGSVEPDSCNTVILDFNAGVYPTGTVLTADIVITNNDMFNPEIIIPVELTIVSTAITQEINLNNGYQFISSNLSPSDPDIEVVMSDVLNDNLDFVRNTQGQMLRKIGNVWVNGIGDWIIEEGYLIKMFAEDSFTIEGEMIDPSTPISVIEGYQFVSYFPESSMDATLAFETIIGDNLDFVRNSQGQILRKIGSNWVNGIGDCQPTEGYLVKMFAAGEIIYPFSEKTGGKTIIVTE